MVWARNLAQHLLEASRPDQWDRLRQVACRTRLIGRVLLEPDEERLLETVAWLHAIGHSPTVVSSGYEPLDAARHLRDHTAFPQRIWGLVAHQASALSGATVLGLGDQLAEFPDERTLTRDVLWHCIAMSPSADDQRAVLGSAEARRNVERASCNVLGALS